MIIWLFFKPISRDFGRFLSVIESYWWNRGQGLSRMFFWTWNDWNRVKFKSKRNLNRDIWAYFARFWPNLNRSRLILIGIFICICCRSCVLINRELRELWRFVCSLQGELVLWAAKSASKTLKIVLFAWGCFFERPQAFSFDWIMRKFKQKSILSDFGWFWRNLNENR